MKELAEYEVIRKIRAPEFKKKEGKTLWYKDFKEGDVVTGYVNKKKVDGVKIVPHVIAQNRWRIPLRNLDKIASVVGETIEASEKLENIANVSALKDISKFSKYSVNGALIGMAMGVMISWYFGKNKFIGAFIGSVAGGMTGRLISKKVK